MSGHNAVLTENHSLKAYASKVLHESSVGVVSSFIKTSNNRRKFFKIFVFILCLTGFIYQSAEFVAAFLQFRTSINIDITRPNIIKVPAVTFCDNNAIKRSLFCKKYPDRCDEYVDEGNKTLVPKKGFYNVIKNMSLEEISELNGNLHDFLLDFQHIQRDLTGPFLKKMRGNDLNIKLCYSENERINRSEDQLQKSWFPLLKDPIQSFTFYVEKNETFIPGIQPGILFSLHSPFLAVNPLENGIFMKPGRTYIIHVSMHEEVLLPNPYDTDCTNYTEQWIQNGRIGPRSQEMCQHSCLQDVSMECLNCIMPVLHFPTTDRICTTEEADVKKCPKHLVEKAHRCITGCKEDCHRTKYFYTMQERYTLNLIEGELKNNVENYIFVEMYFEDAEVLILKHSPKYMMVELFSTIGGFIGCWLGISLLDVSDIFEGFFRITQYAFRR